MKIRVLLLLGLCCGAVQAQTAPAHSSSNHTSVITGRVQDEAGQPLAGVAVAAASAQLPSITSQTVTTNEDGQFRLTNLAPAAFVLRASLPAYVMLPLTGVMGESRYFRNGDAATITLAKGGVITGRVTSANGEPIAGLNIKAIRLRDTESKTSRDVTLARRTDDRGVYRIFGLPSGIYIVGTDGANAGGSWQADEQAADAPTFHPSSTRDAALELIVQTGQELSGIDIRYRSERGRTVSGKFFDGGNSGGVSIELRQPGAAAVIAADWRSIYRVRMDQGVGFELRGVADGEYELVAERRTGDDDGAASAPRRLTVSGADVGGIELRLLSYASVTGKVILDESSSEAKSAKVCQGNRQAAFEEMAIALWRATPPPATNITASAFPLRSGDFRIRHLNAGSYRFNLQLPHEDWYVRALTLPDPRTQRKLDLARTGLTLKAGEQFKGVSVALATDAASLQGKVKVDAGSKAPAGLRAHLVPAEKEAADEVLRYFEIDVASDGGFIFRHLAPGKYWLLARTLSAEETAQPPAAWDNTERLKVRRAAEAANQTVELQPCLRVKDYSLRYAFK